MATDTRPVLHLVHFRDNLYPVRDEDRTLLLERNVTISRIPDSILPTLESTVLKRCRVVQHPFSEVYKSMTSHFVQVRLAQIAGSRHKLESNKVSLSAPYSELDQLNECIVEFQFVMGRYGVKAVREKERVTDDSEGKPLRVAVLLVCRADEDLDPSRFWKAPVLPEVQDFRLKLSNCASLVFSSRPSVAHPGRRTFGVAFEDHLAGEWVQAFRREFNIASLDEGELHAAIAFLASLVNARKEYKPPVAELTRRD